jgi:hypothetical protein
MAAFFITFHLLKQLPFSRHEKISKLQSLKAAMIMQCDHTAGVSGKYSTLLA